MNSVRTRKTHAKRPRKKVEPLGEGLAGKKKRKKYTAGDIELIKRRYVELVEEGLNDTEIAKKIAEKLEGRGDKSVRGKMRKLRNSGEIRENPNKECTDYTDQEIELIKRRYIELVKQGLNDRKITKKISEKLERTADSVENKIQKLRNSGEISENPNKGRINFSEEELELIKRKYAGFVEKGLNDFQIAKEIAKELGRNIGSVDYRIRRMREDGELGVNPNKGTRHFSVEEIELIKRRYAELVKEGLNDAEIARRIGEELDRSAVSVEDKLRQLKKAGEFADVETLREREDILGVVQALEEFGEEDGG